jgi:hypothetical protein
VLDTPNDTWRKYILNVLHNDARLGISRDQIC